MGAALWQFTPRAAILALPGGAGGAAASIRLTPARASAQMRLAGTARLSGTASYILGRNPRAWMMGLPTYAAVRYSAVYPHIDLDFHGHGTSMEYSWLIAPGGDPARIRLTVGGTRRIRVSPTGAVTFRTAAGLIRQQPPVMYQPIDGHRQKISGRYVLRRPNQLALSIGPYDHTKALVIDPTLQYAAVLSGSLDDYVNAIAVDRGQCLCHRRHAVR
jgi:hypothetical protein